METRLSVSANCTDKQFGHFNLKYASHPQTVYPIGSWFEWNPYSSTLYPLPEFWLKTYLHESRMSKQPHAGRLGDFIFVYAVVANCSVPIKEITRTTKCQRQIGSPLWEKCHFHLRTASSLTLVLLSKHNTWDSCRTLCCSILCPQISQTGLYTPREWWRCPQV